MNHTTERFPRATRDAPMRSAGCVSGPFHRTPWVPIDWHGVALGVLLGATLLFTLAVIGGWI
jgi:hypothetical protein